MSVTSSDTNAATVPTPVVIPAGKTSSTFSIKTTPVAVTTPVTITATYGGASLTTTLTVDQPAVSSVAVKPSSLPGGNTATGTITLTGKAPTGGVAVSVTSSDTNAATVPTPVVVPAGKTSGTFKVTTLGVAAGTPVTITADYGNASVTTTLTVTPAALANVTVTPTTISSGQSATGKITLTGKAPTGGASVTVTSSDTTVATVKSPVVIPAGKTSGTFKVTALGVATSTPVTITGTYSGVSKTATLTVTPALLQSISVLPGSAAGGAPVTGTITLSSPAPSGGVSITTMSSNTVLAQTVSPVAVPAGQTSATFAISTSGASVSTPVTISAGYAGATVKTTLTVAPAYTTGFGQGYVTGPQGIAIDPVTQDIYVACWNASGGSVVKFDAYYDYLFTFGASQLKSAVSVAVDSNGNVYVGDYNLSACLKFDSNGNYLSTFDGHSSGINMDLVTGVAVDGVGNVYVLDDVNARIVVFTPSGTVSSQFHVDGESVDIALDGLGNLWVAEWQDHVLGQWSLGGTREIIAGLGNFTQPYGLCIDPNGNIWATDASTGIVQEYNSQGGFVAFYNPPMGNASSLGIAVTRDGHVLVSDANNNYVEIFVPN